MSEEKYINRNFLGEIEISDHAESILQPKYEFRDSFLRPDVKEAYEVGTLGISPSFEVHTDFLGNHHLAPPSGPYLGYAGGGYSPSTPSSAVGAVWLVVGFWWALISWPIMTINRSWQKPLLPLGVTWAVWGIGLAIFRLAVWNRSKPKDVGGEAGIWAAVVQVGVMVYYIVSQHTGVWKFASPIPYAYVMVLPLLHIALFVLMTVVQEHRRHQVLAGVATVITAALVTFLIVPAGPHEADSGQRTKAAPPTTGFSIVLQDAPVPAVASQPDDANPEQGRFGDWPSTAGKPQLTIGDTGDPVSYLQGVLKFAAGQSIDVDGTFGPATRAAVINVQTLYGISADGIVGPDTWVRIDQLATG